MAEKLPAVSRKLNKGSEQLVIAPESREFARELLGLKSGTERDKLKEELDSQIDFNAENFELGQGEKRSKNIEAIQKLKPEILVGSVDSTRFAMEWHEPKWYKPFVEAAVEVENLQDLFDEPTKNWMKELEPALKVFRDLDSLNAANYNRDVKKEIWKVVKAHGGKIIYGEKGLFNFLLSYRRIKTLHPDLGKVDQKDFDIGDLSITKIKLVLGSGKGKEGGKKDRFAYTASRKTKPHTPPPKPILPPEPPKPPAPPRPPEPEEPRKPPLPPEPEEPPKLPTKPDEIPSLIEALNNGKYRVSKKGILSGGMLSKKQEMTSSTITRPDGKVIDTWFVIDKANEENPPFYIAIDSSDPFRVLIGEMNYASGLLTLEGRPGKILRVIDLDKTNRDATIKSMEKILESI